MTEEAYLEYLNESIREFLKTFNFLIFSEGTKYPVVPRGYTLYNKNKKLCVYSMYTSTYCIHTTPYTPYTPYTLLGQRYTLYLQFILQKLKKVFLYFSKNKIGGEKK